jgi:hypothetical protein
MRKHIVVWIVALGVAVAFTAIAAKKAPPKEVTIKACQKTKPPVAFPHEAHVKKAKVACKTCHHKDEGKACSGQGCHAGKAEGKRPGCAELSATKNPFHISCINCHKKEGKGPKACAQCHKK